jgi:hypothetical protein
MRKIGCAINSMRGVTCARRVLHGSADMQPFTATPFTRSRFGNGLLKRQVSVSLVSSNCQVDRRPNRSSQLTPRSRDFAMLRLVPTRRMKWVNAPTKSECAIVAALTW